MKMKNMVVVLALSIGLVVGPAFADDDAIMDVDDNAASFSGTWGTSIVKLLYYGDDYQFAWGAGASVSVPTAEAVWTTAKTADLTGSYQVFVRWSTSGNREETARYRIYDGATYRGYCYQNQTVNGGAWQYCNSVTLTQGNKGVVKLGNEYTDTNEVVIADGVRFVRTAVDTGDIVNETITSLDIKNETITSSDILNNSIYDYDIRDEAGFDYSSGYYRPVSAITTNCSAMTNLRAFSVTAPTSGYVIVSASGLLDGEAGRWTRVCISDVSGGSSSTCDSLAPFLEATTSTGYMNEQRFFVRNVFSVGTGTKTYYLKACREVDLSPSGQIMWDDFIGLFVPTRY